MSKFIKQFIFFATILAILMIGGLVIYSATPGGKVKVNPILGHDLDLNALYYAQAANNTVHDITTEDISISAWVKVDTDAGVLFYVARKSTGVPYYSFYVNSGKVGMNIRDSGSDVYTMIGTGGNNLRDNKWHHIVAIIDRDNDTNCLIYVDGSLVGTTKTGTITAVDSLTNTSILLLGASSAGVAILDGQIRDVKLYYAANDHWSDAQVLYQAQHPFDYTANSGTLTDYWRLDEGTGTTLYGKVNNLTLSNALAWTTQPKIKMVKQENTTTTSNNPVGWWKFDETTAIHGSTLADSSGNGNTGTLSTGDGATNKSVVGKLGRGLSFDGVDDTVSIGTTGVSTTSGAITLWVKKNSSWTVGTEEQLVSIIPLGQYSAYSGFYLSNHNSVGLHFRLSNTAGGYLNYQSSQSFTIGRWYYISVTWDNANNQKMYVDGVQVDSDTITPNPGGAVLNPAYIGSKSGTPQYFNGSIDDVRIYNRALSATEIAQMYNSTKDGYLGNVKVSTGLVGYWKLDDNNALTSVIDYSGKGNTGTAYSGTATSTSVLSTSTAMIGRAMSFDGVDDWVNTGNPLTITNLTPFTISGWFKPNFSSPFSAYALMKYVNENDYVAIYFRSGYIRTMFKSGGVNIGLVDDAVQSAGNWYHVVMVFNPTTKTLTKYVNGSNIYSYSTASIGAGTNTASLLIGTFTTGYYFNGLIDNVKIWNYARSGEQIANDYIIGSKHREE